MDISSSIASMSVSMSNTYVQYQASVAVMKSTMDASEAIAQSLIANLAELSVGFSQNTVDVLV